MTLSRPGAVICAGVLLALSTPLYARPADPPVATGKTDAAPAADGAAPRLVVKASPYRPAATDSATLTVTLAAAAGAAPVAIPKDAGLDLFMVRDDVGDLYWEEAKPGDGGAYTDSFAFPSGGEWRVFGEVIPQDGRPTVTQPAKVTVDGARAVRAPLIPQAMPLQRVSGYTLALKQPTRVAAGGDAQPLVFSLRDSHGQSVTDTDLWRGAIAHLILVDRDAKTLLHVIPDADDPRNGRTEYLVFPARFPRDGVWRGWVAFRRGGQPTMIPFALRVSGR